MLRAGHGGVDDLLIDAAHRYLQFSGSYIASRCNLLFFDPCPFVRPGVRHLICVALSEWKARMRCRLYFLNHENRITNTADIECDTDEQAVAAARKATDGCRIEIWQRNRRVGIFDA
jgi:hypothetical protein